MGFEAKRTCRASKIRIGFGLNAQDRFNRFRCYEKRPRCDYHTVRLRDHACFCDAVCCCHCRSCYCDSILHQRSGKIGRFYGFRVP